MRAGCPVRCVQATATLPRVGRSHAARHVQESSSWPGCVRGRSRADDFSRCGPDALCRNVGFAAPATHAAEIAEDAIGDDRPSLLGCGSRAAFRLCRRSWARVV